MMTAVPPGFSTHSVQFTVSQHNFIAQYTDWLCSTFCRVIKIVLIGKNKIKHTTVSAIIFLKINVRI